MCKSKQTVVKKKLTTGTKSSSGTKQPMDHVAMNTVGTKPFTVEVMLNGKSLSMEVDTGATVSIISDHICRQLFSECQVTTVQC